MNILNELDFKGQVLVPEAASGNPFPDYMNQVEWERHGLENCSLIIFWVPRNMETMPALTTNVEFGLYVTSGRALYGRPDNAQHCRYLDWLYHKYNWQNIYNNLHDLLETAI